MALYDSLREKITMNLTKFKGEKGPQQYTRLVTLKSDDELRRLSSYAHNGVGPLAVDVPGTEIAGFGTDDRPASVALYDSPEQRPSVWHTRASFFRRIDFGAWRPVGIAAVALAVAASSGYGIRYIQEKGSSYQAGHELIISQNKVMTLNKQVQRLESDMQNTQTELGSRIRNLQDEVKQKSDYIAQFEKQKSPQEYTPKANKLVPKPLQEPRTSAQKPPLKFAEPQKVAARALDGIIGVYSSDELRMLWNQRIRRNCQDVRNPKFSYKATKEQHEILRKELASESQEAIIQMLTSEKFARFGSSIQANSPFPRCP